MGRANEYLKGSISSTNINRKVKNATPLIYDGIEFKSKLEAYCYRNLVKHGVFAEYENVIFTIIEPFEYNGQKIRSMTFKPDFVGDNFVIECKGFMNDAFPLRWKVFKYYLYRNNFKYDLYLPRNMKNVDTVIEDIVAKRNTNLNGR